jgi:hypothetical protein
LLERILPIAVLLTAAISWSAAESVAADPAAADPKVVPADYTVSPGNSESHVVPATYSTGQAGHKLKWLSAPARSASRKAPARLASSEAVAPSGVRAVKYDAPIPLPVAARGTLDPFSDPFGETASVSVSGRDAPNKQPGGDALGGKTLQPPLLPQPAASPLDAKPLDAQSIQQSEKVPSPLDNDLLAVRPEELTYECDKAREDIIPLNEVSLDIAPPHALPTRCKMDTGVFEERSWAPTTFMWKASGLCHNPAYFEEIQLERYGHSSGPYTQPVVSAAHFFLTVPVLPYKMGLYPPGECIYTLGYYRPGSCAPYMLDPLPLSIRASLFEAGAWIGGVAAIP